MLTFNNAKKASVECNFVLITVDLQLIALFVTKDTFLSQMELTCVGGIFLQLVFSVVKPHALKIS